MTGEAEHTWVSLDGQLEPVDYPGDCHFRFPEELPPWTRSLLWECGYSAARATRLKQ